MVILKTNGMDGNWRGERGAGNGIVKEILIEIKNKLIKIELIKITF